MKYRNKSRRFKAVKIAFPALIIAIPSYSAYSSQCLMLDSEFGKSPSEITKSGANDFAETVPKEELPLPDKITGEFQSDLTAEISESELVTTLDESLLDAEGVAGLVAGCIQSVPEAIKTHEDQYATALDKASADLSCIPVVGQILGFVDTLIKFEKEKKERAKVNGLMDKLNSANGLNLDDSHFPEHATIDDWIVSFKINSSYIPGELLKTLRSYNMHIKHDQVTKLDYHLDLIANHYAKKFFDDNPKLKHILQQAKDKNVTKSELTELLDPFILSYKSFNGVDTNLYITAVNHMIATNVLTFRDLTKKIGDNKIDHAIDDAVTKLNKYINTLLLKIEDIRKYEYKLKNNLNGKGQSLDSACWNESEYTCEYFIYNRNNDHGVGGWVQRRQEIYDYTDSYTVPAMQAQWSKLSENLQASRTNIENELYSKVLNHTDKVVHYHNTFSSTILSDAGFGDALKYKKIIHEAYIVSRQKNGFGSLNLLYSKIFREVAEAFSDAENDNAPIQYVANSSYEYGKIYSKESQDGNEIWYRYLGQNNRPLTELQSNEEWDLIGSNNILSSTNGISKHDIAMNSSKGMFEFIGYKNPYLTIPSEKDSDKRNWNFVGYYEDKSIIPASDSVGTVVRFHSSNLNLGDIVTRRYLEDNVWKTSYYTLSSKDGSGNYESIPNRNYSNSNWSYSGEKIPLLKSWSFGIERYRKDGKSFQLVFPRYATNRKIYSKYGDYLDSVYLAWTNPVTGLTERTHSVGGDGGDYRNHIALRKLNDEEVNVYYGRSFTSDSVRGIEIFYNTLGHRTSPNKAVIKHLCNISGVTGRFGDMVDRIGFINQCR